ncbi:MAG: hypothetical protein LBP38_03720 [Desulfovibrio sp.]|jgi:hypothetical protein|nr:hypothetical protein [Desulfovibrio sp.]
MNIVNTLPAPVVQMGHVEKIVEMQQNLPYAQQAALGDAAVRALEREREKIEAGAEAELAAKVRERAGGRGGRNAGGGSQPAPERERGGGEADEDGGGAKSGRPWSGRLLDITI